MATVWIFFGSDDAIGGAAGAAGAAAGGETGAALASGAASGGVVAAGGAVAGATDAGMFGVPDATIPAGAEFGSGKIGMVETTRGAGFTGAGILTGCSSRDTSFSPELAFG